MYGGYASSVINKKNDLNFVMINVHNLDFDGIWKSQAGEKLLSSLDSIMNKITTETGNLTTFANAIKRIDECIEIDAKIAELSAALNAIDTSTEEGAEAAAAIQAEIIQLEQKKEQIKNEVKGAISGFASVGTEYAMSFTGLGAVSWNELLQKAEQYSKLPAGDLLAALTIKDENGNIIRDGEEYVNGIINSIKDRYTGVERNVLVTNAIIDLSLEAGVRVPYEHNGTASSGKTIDTRYAVPTSVLSRGVDCNAFVSYVIFGEDSAEKWLPVQQYPYAGQGVNTYEEMQSGDIFTNGKHVGMIVANNPETGEALILHASGQEVDMRFEKVNYNYFTAKGHTIRRVDSTYVSDSLADILGIDASSDYQPVTTSYVTKSNLNSNNYDTTVSLSLDAHEYLPSVEVGTVNRNGELYSGKPLNAPQGRNDFGPMASETWYDLNMNGVVNNMEKLYGYSNLEYSIREDGVKLLSGVDPNGNYFEDLVMVAADVYHEYANPNGTFQRGEIVETSLGTAIVADYCEESVRLRNTTGEVRFDIATAWGTGEYKEAAYSKDYN